MVELLNWCSCCLCLQHKQGISCGTHIICVLPSVCTMMVYTKHKHMTIPLLEAFKVPVLKGRSVCLFILCLFFGMFRAVRVDQRPNQAQQALNRTLAIVLMLMAVFKALFIAVYMATELMPKRVWHCRGGDVTCRQARQAQGSEGLPAQAAPRSCCACFCNH